MKEPKIKSILMAVEGGLTALLSLQNSPILKKVEKALRALIAGARNLSDALTAVAISDMESARSEVQDALRGEITDEERAQLSGALALGTYKLYRGKILQRLENKDARNFQEFSGLKAAERLFLWLDGKLNAEANERSDALSLDEHKIIQIGYAIAEKQDVTDEDMEYLAGFFERTFNKKMDVFALEVMLVQWQATVQELQEAVATTEHERHKLERELAPLTFKFQQGVATEEEAERREQILSGLPSLKALLQAKRDEFESKRTYVHAAEAQLQLLEGDAVNLGKKPHLEALAPEVSDILLRSFEADRLLSDLTQEERQLVQSFAYEFSSDAQARLKRHDEIQASEIQASFVLAEI